MEKKNITAVIYARVSTNSQDYDRQLNDLREYASRMGYEVVKEFAEKISGAKKVVEREALTELLSFVEANHIDKVLIYECSRLSRRVADFINIVDRLNELHISLYIHQNGLETLQADGKVIPSHNLLLECWPSSTVWSATSSVAVWKVGIITSGIMAVWLVARLVFVSLMRP